MLPVFKRDLTNQGNELKTTLINTCRTIEERKRELGKNLLKGRESMLGESMKTYIRAVDTKKEREALLTDRVNANMSQWKGVKERHSEPWCERSLIGENL